MAGCEGPMFRSMFRVSSARSVVFHEISLVELLLIFNLGLQFYQAVQDRLGTRRTAGDIDIHREIVSIPCTVA